MRHNLHYAEYGFMPHLGEDQSDPAGMTERSVILARADAA
jgi:hypothetical protein